MTFRARSSGGARPFSRAVLTGGKRGRPATTSRFQFAGDPDRLGPEARRLIASQGWQWRRGNDKPETAPTRRSIATGADISAIRGADREGRRFDGEGGWYNPDAAANGGSGTSPKNPWT